MFYLCFIPENFRSNLKQLSIHLPCSLVFSEGFVFVSVDFWRQSPLPSVLDCSTFCCLLYIWLSQRKLLHCWQVERDNCYFI